MLLPGTRINPSVATASTSLIEAFASVVTPHISDNLGRHIGARGLTRYNRTGKLVGTALTVKTRPGDNLYIYKALMMLKPGHVLVIDGQGDTNNAVIGELIKLYALQRGCVGFVVDGAIRDVACFENTPCYARAVVHCGPYKTGPGEINVPVSIGGMVINPGDIVVGDEDGLVAFSQEAAEDVLVKAREHEAHEERVKAEIATHAVEQSWITNALVKAGLM
ncbi:RraA family protein [Pseudomonas gingeri]|uniref:Putative 4-hydroxy-4-methyl-2-oxoglutarate aldolase n=1 Tax=Pseudomonas gingeri TaxID=117681 RepID=A0A7Y7YG24_9PSED|nr:RraA family protein [Pseudomonas gingeri]NWA03291.1 RraA family protein [Pseudomonas gingeri]NWA14148.1 RraA family protein [Pseudomonas gingeri]NWA55234.1 RraA family protein [Pseudomonas gingeri]NWA94958.1 RraA family protein [Pseudomonas gingeri]NWB01614.1 RraA family protein [Pseudomonas gingeri]